MLFPIMYYIYNKVADKVDAWNFVEGLRTAVQYKDKGYYAMPIVDIDGNFYFDAKSLDYKYYSRIEDVILLLQDTKEVFG